MCGIVGYVGYKNAVERVTKGLSVLEYRGYDSIGIATEKDGLIRTIKCKGRISSLRKLLLENNIHNSFCAIGHTRWATHGGPSDINAHPHRYGHTTIVHNGIIENYKQIQLEINAATISETDTEVAAALIDKLYCKTNDPIKAINESISYLRGSYAFGILFDGIEDTIFAVRKDSPLLLARSSDGYFISSDLTAILSFTDEYFSLAEGDIARLTKFNIEIFSSDGNKKTPKWQKTNMTAKAAQKDGFDHFMLKEMFEQPEVIKKSIAPRITNGLPSYSVDGISEDFLKNIKNIQIVGCGSAVHAGIIGGRFIEEWARVPVSIHVASEYRYNPLITNKGTLVIVISQSGETADTLAALRYAKNNSVETLAIVNAPESTIAREADKKIYTYAGPEIAVATTKGYCTQLAQLYLLAVAIGCSNGNMCSESAKEVISQLYNDAPTAISEILSNRSDIKNIAEKIYKKDHVFYIGRGFDYGISMEAALKLKEISYIHCEAYAAGELKHGTISLIEEGTPVIALSTQDELYDKMENSIKEIKSRGAFVVQICKNNVSDKLISADEVIRLPCSSPASTLFASMTAVQLIAYETALLRGCDVDRPRNLAKSVTVE